MEDLPNIRWLDTVAVLPDEGHSKETSLYSSRYIGVQYTMVDNNGYCSWKAFAPKSKDSTGRKRYVGTYRSERDAALAHDCYAREIGCTTLNFRDEFIYEEEAEKLRLSSSSSISSCSVASLSSCDHDSITPQQNHDDPSGGGGGDDNNSKLQNEENCPSLQQEVSPTTINEIPTQINEPVEVTTRKQRSYTGSSEEPIKSSKAQISKYRGVVWMKRGAPWKAQCAIKKVVQSLGTPYIGTYNTEIEAAVAYDEIIRKHGRRKDEKYLNFPEQDNNDEKLPLSETNRNRKGPIVKKQETKRKRKVEERISSEKRSRNGSKDKPAARDDDITNKNNNKEVCLSGLAVGDRIAFDFGNGIYFGCIEECDTNNKVNAEWNWNVSFDDGERYKFDYKDMSSALTLYEELKIKEMKDPGRKKKVRKIKDDFIIQKNYVLSTIPTEVKNHFLQVGFALWQKRYLPVLFLGPYDVPPGIIRDEWLAAFEKVSFDVQIYIYKNIMTCFVC